MPISGSFVRGNWSGRFVSQTANHDRALEKSTYSPFISNHDRALEKSTTGFISSSLPIVFRGSFGGQGISLNGSLTSLNSDAPFGKHMQVGVMQNTTDGSPSSPCLELDYPGSWRFRWVVKGPTRTISILTKQNSTGSFRPSMVIKANPSIGVNQDVSGSAPDGAGWVVIGPLTITPTGTGSLWVELWNNNSNYPMLGYSDNSVLRPALFDHIVTT